MIVELYGGPGDGTRCDLPDGREMILFRHAHGGRLSPVCYERCPDGVPYEQIAAPDGTQRLMVHRGQREVFQ